MFCSYCSFPLEEGDRFCARCGRRTVEGASSPERLLRSAERKKVAGVCDGVARYFHVDPTLVRLGWVGASVLPFSPGLFAYMVCWAVMPREKAERKRAAGRPSRPQSVDRAA